MGIHIILFAGWFNYMAKSKWFKWIAQLEIHSCWVFQGFRLKGKLEKSSEWFSPWNEVKRWPKKIWASLLALNGRLGLQHCLAIFSAAAVSYRTCSRGNPWAKNVHFGLDLYVILWMYRHPPPHLPPHHHPTYFPKTHIGCAVCTSSEMLRGPIHLLTRAHFLVVPLLQMRSGAVAVFNARLLELHLQCTF